MKIIKTIKEMQIYRSRIKNRQVGFVPTMGALHQGHLSLVDQSLDDYQLTIVSIFVNPTQFDNEKDLENYPNQLENDLDKLKKAGVNCVFLPDFEQMYPDDYHFTVHENQLSKKYCGAHREGHFDGVLTIVMKLLNIVQPSKAYFGEKDFQQLNLIQQMVDAFFMSTKIIAGKTIREHDGLAMSSRNLNLTKQQRQLAPMLYQIISSDESLEHMHNQLTRLGFKLDYLEVMNNRLLVAAYLGNVRLIDNVELNPAILEQAA